MPLISYTEALARVLAAAPLLSSETVPLAQAHGRVLAEDCRARITAPRSAVSTMDGYAMRGDPGSDALRIIGEARPGAGFAGAISQGEAVRIFTGGALPDGADRVIVQEHALHEGDKVRFTPGHGPDHHWRAAGSDYRIGDVLLPSGTRLTPRALVAAAAADLREFAVARQPRVAILVTGDELVTPGDASAHAEAVPDSIGAALAAFIVEEGGTVCAQSRHGDDPAALAIAATTALTGADLVVVTGGASVGAHDHARMMFGSGLELIVDKVAIKPGKPVWLGRAQGRLVMGLPGNPGSALVTAALFLRPLLREMQGANGTPAWYRLPLLAPLARTGVRETFVRARLVEHGLEPLGNQDSGAQRPLVQADWLIRCPCGQDALDSGVIVSAIEF